VRKTATLSGLSWLIKLKNLEARLQCVCDIELVCARHDMPLRAAAIQFPLANPLVTSVIPGASFPHQLSQNINDLSQTIPEGFWLELRERHLIRPGAPIAPPPKKF